MAVKDTREFELWRKVVNIFEPRSFGVNMRKT
jgi:hypothetical protein